MKMKTTYEDFGRFWEGEVIATPGEKMNISDLYRSYVIWCEENNIMPVYKAKGLSRVVASRYKLQRKHIKSVYYFEGYQVRRYISSEEHNNH